METVVNYLHSLTNVKSIQPQLDKGKRKKKYNVVAETNIINEYLLASIHYKLAKCSAIVI